MMILRKPRKTCFLALGCCLVLLSCHENKSGDPAGRSRNNGGPLHRPPIPAEGFVVRTRLLTEDIEVPGTLLPFEATEIRPEISGRLTGIYFKEGGTVTRGTLLAKLFDGDLQAQLQKLKVQLAIAQKTLERQQALLKINGVSQQEVDLSQLDVNNIQADMDLVQVNIAKTEIRAPYSGRLGLRNVSIGAYITPTTVITNISQVHELKLDFTVPEKYSDNFAKGRKVAFTIEGFARSFTATVLATESSIEADTRSLKVRADVKGDHPALVPGAFATVSLRMGGGKPSLIIPSQAVIPQARDKEVIVYRNGAADFQVVETGIRDSAFVQITKGLQAGDTVVTTGLLAIKPNSKINITRIQ